MVVSMSNASVGGWACYKSEWAEEIDRLTLWGLEGESDQHERQKIEDEDAIGKKMCLALFPKKGEARGARR